MVRRTSFPENVKKNHKPWHTGPVWCCNGPRLQRLLGALKLENKLETHELGQARSGSRASNEPSLFFEHIFVASRGELARSRSCVGSRVVSN
jgi:hypothetical protein